MTFGRHPAVQSNELPVVDLHPGDRVEFTFGRYRGSAGVVEEILKVPTPSGREVMIARVKRPRAGETWEFPCCLRLAK